MQSGFLAYGVGLGYEASLILGPIGPEPISLSMTAIGFRLGTRPPDGTGWRDAATLN